MPNHFHLLIKQSGDDGIQEFIRKVQNSYTKYFNIRYQRVGPLLQGPFKAVLVESDDQLLHLSRYIHLNPYVSELVDNLELYPYSSYRSYINLSDDILCVSAEIVRLLGNNDYKEFVQDHANYAVELEQIEHIVIDD